MILENKNILIISGEAWGPIWFSKHNYAWQLSKKNKVFFIDPPERFSFLNVLIPNLTVKQITSSLTVLTYKNIFPVKNEYLRLLNEKIIFKKIKKFLAGKNVSNPLFWTFDPTRLSSPEKLNSELLILHAVDHFLFTFQSEKILCDKANVVFCVSKEILEDFLNYNKNAHLIPHAIPSDEFLPQKINSTQKLTGIFAGTLDLRIDFDYLEFIINKFPAIQFKFIGKTNIKNAFTNKLLNKNFSNAVFEGEKPFEDVKYHIQNADFCILFKDNKLHGNSISSHKMLQYMAQGKPVFCSELSQHKDVQDLLYMTNDKYKMEKLLCTFVEQGENKDLIAKRIEYAAKHSFDATLQKIEQILN